MMVTESEACANSPLNSNGKTGFVDKSIALKYKSEASLVEAVATQLFFCVESGPLSSSDHMKADVDVERVAHFKKLIDDGEYAVDALSVAKGMWEFEELLQSHES